MFNYQHVLAGWEIEDKIRSAANGKADKHEVHSLDSRVGSMEHSMREARAETDGLRARVLELEARLESALAALEVK